MPTFQQLAEPGRAALQRLHQSVHCGWTLFQADNVLALHRCSSVDNLLHPLSLSHDSGLYRALAVHSNTVSPLTATIEETRGRVVQSMPASHPSGRFFFPPPTHQHHPLEPIVGSDSPRSQQLVRELFDRLEHGHRGTGQTPPERSGPFPSSQRHQPSSGTPLNKVPLDLSATADRDDHGLNAIRRKGSSPSFFEIVPESGPSDWFSRHPRHLRAASRVVTATTHPEISQTALQSWVDFSAAPHSPRPIPGGPLTSEAIKEKAPGTVAASSRKTPLQESAEGDKKPSTTLPVQGSLMSRAMISPLPSAALTQPSLSAPKQPIAPSGSATTSQLELLVQQWQKTKAVAPGVPQQGPTQPKRSQQTGPLLSKSSSPAVMLHHRGLPEGQPQAGISRDRLPATTADFSSQNDHENRPLSSETPAARREGGDWERFSTLLHATQDTDHLIAEALGRILNREIRRYGLEEEP